MRINFLVNGESVLFLNWYCHALFRLANTKREFFVRIKTSSWLWLVYFEEQNLEEIFSLTIALWA